jgi:hypothetical protein
MNTAISFKINGKEYTCSKKDVERALKNIPPEEVNTYYIRLYGKRYPVKQVLSQTLKIGRSTFITTVAHRQLEKMGFEVGCTLYSG